MDELKLAGWQRIYQEALDESDQVKLLTKICAAESVLYAYLQQRDGPTQRNEVIAVFDAIHSLRILRSRLYSQTKRDELALIWKQSGQGYQKSWPAPLKSPLRQSRDFIEHS